MHPQHLTRIRPTGWLALCAAAALTACGGGGSSSGTDMTASQLSSDTEDALRTASGVLSSGGSSASKGYTTANVLCGISASEFNSSASVQLMATYAWVCSGTTRTLTANGVPNHEVGSFPNADNPNTISTGAVSASYALAPAIANKTGTSTAIPGMALNGVKFDPGTAGTCNDAGDNCDLGQGGTGIWRVEALGQSSFKFGTDANNAHVQPTGEYHYHGMPEHYISKLGGDNAMRLVGWATDGFPIYARKGYTSKLDASSGLKTLVSSYRLKSTPDANRPSTSLYAMGAFSADYEYVAGLGDLDECNGRTGVTPEFPSGIYHYVITDSYPFIQRCIKGTGAAAGNGPSGPPSGPPPVPSVSLPTT